MDQDDAQTKLSPIILKNQLAESAETGTQLNTEVDANIIIKIDEAINIVESQNQDLTVNYEVTPAFDETTNLGGTEIIDESVNVDEPTIINDRTNTDETQTFEKESDHIINYTNEMSPVYLPRSYELMPEWFDPTNAPESYISNNDNENKCIHFMDNFRRQYRNLYKDRKPLILTPENEYGVRKFISTFLKPTKLPFRDLYSWKSISSFVSDYLVYVPVLPSTEFPKRILSTTKVLEIQMGTSFEYSNFLCSLLLGVGYDAYVVAGYATRECCLVDESRNHCPFLEVPEEKVVKNKEVKVTKYTVKPAKDLKSKFQLYFEARQVQEAEVEKRRLEIERINEEKNRELPPHDPLNGLRVHCWILVKAPLRDVYEDFFIEPLTGNSYAIKDDIFRGIEMIYNDQNCWVNMQNCANGIQNMEYDLDDLKKWEFVLPTTLNYQKAKVIKLDASLPSSDNDASSEIKGNHGLLNIIECPSSWVKSIEIKLSDYERRFPNGHKTTVYYKVKCERYSPYLNPNGMILKMVLYTDRSLQHVVEEQEHYCNKADKLYKVLRKDGWTIEYFHECRSHQLIEHHFETLFPEPETNRKLLFSSLRVDGLIKREESPTYLIETYAKRADHMTYLACYFDQRHVQFVDDQSQYRTISKIIKRYERNHDLHFADDVHELIYYISEERIFITYHVDQFGFIPNTREYFKPQLSEDGRNTVPFHVDTHYVFQANPMARKDKTKLEIYQYLLALIIDEKKSKDMVRWSEMETKNILHSRRKEKIHQELELSLYDSLRNDVAKALRIELEALDETERNKRKEDELDYLAPFLSQLGLVDIESREQAFTIREECLQDFKLRLIENANIIQSRFEDETRLLQKNQQWYQQNQINLNKEDETKYINACNNSTFKINTLETMLAKHKQIAPHKYMTLERKIRSDPRMKMFFANI